MTEWRVWMDRDEQFLAELAQAHEFEIVSLGGGRKHMDLPEYWVAGQEQVIATEQDWKWRTLLRFNFRTRQMLIRTFG